MCGWVGERLNLKNAIYCDILRKFSSSNGMYTYFLGECIVFWRANYLIATVANFFRFNIRKNHISQNTVGCALNLNIESR